MLFLCRGNVSFGQQLANSLSEERVAAGYEAGPLTRNGMYYMWVRFTTAIRANVGPSTKFQASALLEPRDILALRQHSMQMLRREPSRRMWRLQGIQPLPRCFVGVSSEPVEGKGVQWFCQLFL